MEKESSLDLKFPTLFFIKNGVLVQKRIPKKETKYSSLTKFNLEYSKFLDYFKNYNLNFYDTRTSLKLGKYIIENNIQPDYLICSCGKQKPFNTTHNKINTFCSTKCSNSNSAKLNKTKETCLTKYREISFSKTTSFKDKYKSTMLFRYGVPHNFNLLQKNKGFKKDFKNIDLYHDKIFIEKNFIRKDKSFNIVKFMSFFDVNQPAAHRKLKKLNIEYKKRSSKGEDRVSDFLEFLNLDFKREYNFQEGKTFRFDFYIPEYNLAIEYDGELHYHSIDIFGGDENLISTKKRDNIKNQYCKENGIYLLRIPYWYFDNIEELIQEKIEYIYYKETEGK
jgi:very-short-patch-repair endonuclease